MLGTSRIIAVEEAVVKGHSRHSLEHGANQILLGSPCPGRRSGNFQVSTSRSGVPRPLPWRTANPSHCSHCSFDKCTISHDLAHAMRAGPPWQEKRGSLGPTPLFMAQNHSFPIKRFPTCVLSPQNNCKRLSMSMIQIKCRAFCSQVNQTKSNQIKASRVIPSQS
jgi:hypothetical protein